MILRRKQLLQPPDYAQDPIPCTVTDDEGCIATTVAVVTQPGPVVVAPIADVTICNGASTTLTASASGGNPGGYNYLWSPAGTGSTASVTVSPAATTVYTVNATDIANGCAAAPVSVTVTVNPLLNVSTGGTTSICPGGSASLTATASNGNGGPYTYSWSPATGLSSATIQNPTATPAATTTYIVTASDGCSPTATASVTVTVNPLPAVNFTANTTSGCSELCVTFTDNSTVSGGSIATWSWDFGDSSAPSVSSGPTHCYAVPDGDPTATSYNVTLTVSSSLGGCTSTTTYTNYITVFPNPIAAFSAPQSVSILNPVVAFTDNSVGADTWAWDFGEPGAIGSSNNSNVQHPSHTYEEVGSFCAALIVTNIHGCVDTAINCVVIDPEFTFYIPNAFSPNDDGVNDEFYGKGEYIAEFEMTIFDRWGNLIFFADDITKRWDGKANHGDEIAQQDIYVYVVRIKDMNDKKHKYTGTVTIVK